jgi:hypothetical protein
MSRLGPFPTSDDESPRGWRLEFQYTEKGQQTRITAKHTLTLKVPLLVDGVDHEVTAGA